jgi:hypothetical protein
MAEAVADGAKHGADELGIPERAQPSSRAALAVVGAAVLAGLIVPGSRAGLGLTVAAMAILVGALVDARVRTDPWRVAMLVAAELLVLAPMVRDAAWLVTWDLLAALVLATVALADSGTWGDYGRAAGRYAFDLIAGTESVIRLTGGRIPWRGEGVGAVARGLFLAVLLVSLFAGLFAWADGAFAHLFGNAFPDLDDIGIWESIGVALLALAAGSALSLASRHPRAEPERAEPDGALAAAEWGIALVALVALFAAFVGVQAVVLFGGQHHVLETAGLTYAEYAREGFWQLLVVAALVLGVVALALRFAKPEGPAQQRLFRGLLAALCVLTLIVLASAVHRLDLYVDAFGATRARLQAVLACVWVAGVLIATAVALFTRGRAWLPRSIALLSATLAIAITLANPDGLVAQRNVDRFESNGRLDEDYNARLSADATPALAGLPAIAAAEVLSRQRDRLATRDGLWGFNVGRARARDRMDELSDP